MKKILATLVIAITALCSTAMAGTMTDRRDGHVYRTVQIGNQVWMKENMAIKVEGSYPPNGDYDNVPYYGRLYTWQAAKMVCPIGWHLPSKQEFEQLLINVCGREFYFFGEIKEKGCDEKLKNKGFRPLHAGDRWRNGVFNNIGSIAYFWSATPIGDDYAYNLTVHAVDAGVYDSGNRNDALSVRCLQDSN